MKRFGLLMTLLALLAAGVVLAQMNDPDQGQKQGSSPDPAPGLAQAPGCGPGHGHGPGMGNMLECRKDLDLTEEQIDKIKEINFNHHNLMIGLRADLEKGRLSERHEMGSDNPDKAKVLAATKQINDIQGKIEVAQVEHRFALRGVLTKEQLEKWNDCQPLCQGRCEGPRGDGPQERGPRGCGMPQGQQIGCGMPQGQQMGCGMPQGAKMGCGR